MSNLSLSLSLTLTLSLTLSQMDEHNPNPPQPPNLACPPCRRAQVDALALLAEQLAARHLASTSHGTVHAHGPACPFGCAALDAAVTSCDWPHSTAAPAPVLLRPCGTESLADRMLKLSAANPHSSPVRGAPASSLLATAGASSGARAAAAAAASAEASLGEAEVRPLPLPPVVCAG
jgi:hypothetical protein